MPVNKAAGVALRHSVRLTLCITAAWLFAASWAQAQTVQCPATVRLQVKRIAPFAPDAAAGSIRGFAQVFSPRRVRLVGVELGMVRDKEQAPSFALQPDDLTIQLGRRSTWTLWNGAPPVPDGELHLVCEYEGGLTLNKAVGSRIRHCQLDTTVVGSRSAEVSSKNKGKDKAPAGRNNKPAATDPARKADDGEAAAFAVESVQYRPVASRAVLTCR